MGDVRNAPGRKLPSHERSDPLRRQRQPHPLGTLLSRACRHGRDDCGRRRAPPGGALMILVTGGTGHLGTELVPMLTARGTSVRVLTRDTKRARERLGPIPELVEGDARQATSMRRALHGVE